MALPQNAFLTCDILAPTSYRLLLDMYVLLWERNLDAVLVESVVDGAKHVADNVRLLDGVGPDEHLEVDAGIAQFANNGLDLLRGIHPLVFQVVDCM